MKLDHLVLFALLLVILSPRYVPYDNFPAKLQNLFYVEKRFNTFLLPSFLFHGYVAISSFSSFSSPISQLGLETFCFLNFRFSILIKQWSNADTF